jgi:plastocyanin
MIATPPPPPARVQVVAQEFLFTLSRPTIKAGDAIVELRNGGEDAHDMLLKRVGGTKTYAWPTVEPGDVVDRELKLAPGRYTIWCGVANHRALGMTATLVVKR